MADRYDYRIDRDVADTIKQRVNDPSVNALDWAWQYVAPTMSERRRARTATLLSLASEPDRNGVRGRIHALYPGPGGTGKTVLRDWVKNTFDCAYGVGPGSSDTGLRYNANVNKPGKLHMADGGVLCVEEFDKFDRDEWEATYESMSDGYFEVDKGGVDAEIDAETRIIAVCNETRPFSQPLLSRFDFIVEMDEYDAAETITVGEDITDQFISAFIKDEDGAARPFLPQYLSYIQGFRPGLTDDFAGQVKQCLRRLVHEEDMVGDIRGKEAYLRIAYTAAKLDMRDVEVEDWVRAVDLVHPDIDAAGLYSDFL